MVFLPIPSQHTEEEKFLQQKYLKLKKKVNVQLSALSGQSEMMLALSVPSDHRQRLIIAFAEAKIR